MKFSKSQFIIYSIVFSYSTNIHNVFKIPTCQDIGIIQGGYVNVTAIFHTGLSNYIFLYIPIGQLICFFSDGQKF